MQPVTVSLRDEHTDLLEELSADGGPCTNRSEAMRMIIDQYNETNDLRQENERLRNEKRLILEQREEHTELVNAVKDDRTLAQRKADAGLLTKTKWALFGMGTDENE